MSSDVALPSQLTKVRKSPDLNALAIEAKSRAA